MNRKTKKKATVLAVTYSLAAFVALGAYAWAGQNALADYRLAAGYGSGRAFEETVRAVDQLSRSLKKSVYATDGSMCGLICSEAYANALAAETAMSTLPFATQELEQISAFLNVAGDYAYTLCGEAAENGFTREQVETLTDMSQRAAELSQTLLELRGSVNDGSVLMDSRETRLENVNQDQEPELLSARMLAYEQGLQPAAELSYDGKYGAAAKGREQRMGGLSEGEQRILAARYAGTEPDQLESAYEYQDGQGVRSYWAGDRLISVGPQGIISLAQSRLVGEANMEPDQARQIAEQYLEEQGYEGLELRNSRVNGAIASLTYCKAEDDALCLDNTLSVSVALDDGSIYSFSAANYSDETTGAAFEIEPDQAEETLPQGLELQESRKVVIKSAGGQDQACYELRCTDKDGQEVKIYVDAATGRQRRIEL